MSEEKTRVCPTCGKAFETKDPRKTFCSRKCQHGNYYLKNRKEALAYGSIMYAGMCEKFGSDSEAYARHREKTRIACRRNYERTHHGCKAYRPRLCTRIPDYATKGSDVLNRGSVFLTGNMSDEQVMAAKAFALQQEATEDRHHPHVTTIFRSR